MAARRPLLSVLAAVIFLISAVSCILYKANSEQSQKQLLADIMARNDLRAKQLAESVSQRVDALIRLLDMATTQLIDAYLDGQPGFQAMVGVVMKSLPVGSVSRVVVVGADGHVVYSSDAVGLGVDLSDRSNFRFHAKGGESQLLIDNPIKSRLSGDRWVIPVSRAIRQDHRFLGVLIISLHPEYFANNLRLLSLNAGDVVALLQNDGTFLARNRNLEAALGNKVPPNRPFFDSSRSDNETFRALSSLDGVPVDFAWKRLASWPLIAVVGLDERAEMAPIRTSFAAANLRRNIILAAVMGFSVVVAGLLLWAQRQQQELFLSKSQHLRDAQRYQSLLKTACDGIHVLDEDGNLIEASDSFWQMLGYVPGEQTALNVQDWDAVLPIDEIKARLREYIGSSAVFETKHRCLDGRVIDVEVNCRGIEFDGTRHVYASSRDITERKVAEHKIQGLMAYQRAVLERTPVGIAVVNTERRILEANQSFHRIFGFEGEDLRGRNARALFSDEKQYEEIEINIDPVLECGETFTGEFLLHCHNGQDIWVRVAASLVDVHSPDLGVIWVTQDITEMVRLTQDLKELARTDSLTGLANRRAFIEAAETEFQRRERFGSASSMLMIDIDHFKRVNDTCGHEVGDKALVCLAAVLKTMARATDLPARFGGEEFVFLLVGTDLSGAMEMAERIRKAVAQIVVASSSGDLGITVSIGGASFEAEDEDWSDVMCRADKAMYRAKEQGRNRVAVC